MPTSTTLVFAYISGFPDIPLIPTTQWQWNEAHLMTNPVLFSYRIFFLIHSRGWLWRYAERFAMVSKVNECFWCKDSHTSSDHSAPDPVATVLWVPVPGMKIYCAISRFLIWIVWSTHPTFLLLCHVICSEHTFFSNFFIHPAITAAIPFYIYAANCFYKFHLIRPTDCTKSCSVFFIPSKLKLMM